MSNVLQAFVKLFHCLCPQSDSKRSFQFSYGMFYPKVVEICCRSMMTLIPDGSRCTQPENGSVGGQGNGVSSSQCTNPSEPSTSGSPRPSFMDDYVDLMQQAYKKIQELEVERNDWGNQCAQYRNEVYNLQTQNADLNMRLNSVRELMIEGNKPQTEAIKQLLEEKVGDKFLALVENFLVNQAGQAELKKSCEEHTEQIKNLTELVAKMGAWTTTASTDIEQQLNNIETQFKEMTLKILGEINEARENRQDPDSQMELLREVRSLMVEKMNRFGESTRILLSRVKDTGALVGEQGRSFETARGEILALGGGVNTTLCETKASLLARLETVQETVNFISVQVEKLTESYCEYQSWQRTAFKKRRKEMEGLFEKYCAPQSTHCNKVHQLDRETGSGVNLDSQSISDDTDIVYTKAGRKRKENKSTMSTAKRHRHYAESVDTDNTSSPRNISSKVPVPVLCLSLSGDSSSSDISSRSSNVSGSGSSYNQSKDITFRKTNSRYSLRDVPTVRYSQ